MLNEFEQAVSNDRQKIDMYRRMNQKYPELVADMLNDLDFFSLNPNPERIRIAHELLWKMGILRGKNILQITKALLSVQPTALTNEELSEWMKSATTRK